ncbi:uncharacterized protein [Linepithema humile]|uniref:uncharacterized protein isoform X4 n=1 Tax=Linepithema humile TaxID=83485 RepID=UPI00351E512D
MSRKETIEFSIEDINIAKNIKVPTVYWFTNINNSCMMWTCWTRDLHNILRRVIIKANMKVQVFIGDKEISFDTKIIHNIQEIEQILKKLENFFPCQKVNNENRVTNCHGFVIKEQYRGENMRCLACKRNWKILLRKAHNLTPMQKLRNKSKKLQVSNLNHKRREKRLRNKPFKGTWVQSLACFLSVGSASASILHKIIMECIILTEQCGLKVDAVVSDGASWNRSMWNIFGVKEECFDRYAGIWFFNVAPTMQILKEANIHHDLNDADGSIKFCKRVNALITAMNSRTPKNSLRPDNKIYKRFFGMMRNCGSNDHPDSQLFIQIYRLISTYSLVKPPKGCNVSTGEIMNVLLNIKDIEDTKEREEQWISQIDTILDRGRNNEILAYAPSILNDHDLHICTTSDYILTYIAGYVARKGNRFSKNIINNKNVICEECLKTLILQPNDVIPERHKLIQIKTKGYLKNPSIALFNLLSILEKGIIEATKCGEINVNTLFEIMELIDEEKNSLSSVVKNINMNLLKILFAFI